MIEYDVAVVGASVAGSSITQRLAQQCSKIALIDSAEFPRRKPCGEGVSQQGLRELQLLGVDLGALRCQPLSGYRIRQGSSLFELPLTEESTNDPAGGIGISREVLDTALLQSACRRTEVDAFLGQKLMSYELFPNSCRLKLANGTTISSRLLVLASGAHTRSKKQRAAKRKQFRYGYSCGYHSLLSTELCSKVHILLQSGFEIYITPTGTETINVAVLAPHSIFSYLFSESGRRNVETLLRNYLDRQIELIAPPLPTGPLGTRRNNISHGRNFFIGDACEQFDPIGGMGITHALVSSRLAAEALLPVLNGRSTPESAAVEYEKHRNRAARQFRGFTRLSSLLLVRNSGTPPVTLPLHAVSPLAKAVSRAVHGSSQSTLAQFTNVFVTLAGL